jgi:glycerol-3-phosphate dehydrogenase (NAD(P)+)
MSGDSFLVFGAGAWGTAIATQLSRSNQKVVLSSFDKNNLLSIKQSRENKKYLPGFLLPKEIKVSLYENKIMDQVGSVVVCVKSPYFFDAVSLLAKTRKNKNLLWATKGFDPKTGRLFSELIEETLGKKTPYAVVSGPTFAQELAEGKPAAITLASKNIKNPGVLAKQMSNKTLRVYLSDDPVGVQLGGGLKNIVAVAAGVSDALEMGANARAALVTRGLNEIKLLGQKLGGNEKTFMGLSGMGDLMLSCTDDKSRNRLLGLSVGSGLSFKEATKLQGSIPEGAHAVKTLVEKNIVTIEQPIMFAVYKLLYGGLDVKKVAEELMLRPIKGEF